MPSAINQSATFARGEGSFYSSFGKRSIDARDVLKLFAVRQMIRFSFDLSVVIVSFYGCQTGTTSLVPAIGVPIRSVRGQKARNAQQTVKKRL
ncbi:hypothetical protein [uncultured Cohaesibacter sp.]|uniref:hypothetical protein n=1 Tax=uncultured Cohaesibacter sp. TaxID=1002546 RepID=UPI0029C72480|nr:hypothetical protein [uncultured Cohaesibacter sp.]